MCVIGVGNAERGDDGVGPAVIARLREGVAARVSLFALAGETGELVDRLAGAQAVWIVDAAVSGAAPGTVYWLDVVDGRPVPRHAAASTHGLGVAEAVELARALGQLPAVCRLAVIEGACFAIGSGLSAPVAKAVEGVVERLRAEVNEVIGDA